MKIILHKQLPNKGTIPEGQKYVFIFERKDGQTAAVTKEASYEFNDDSLNDYAVGGNHSCRIYKEIDGVTTQIDNVQVFLTAGITNEKSRNEEILNAITSVLEGRAIADIASYSLAGRSVAKMPLPDLVRFQNSYKNLVRAEKEATTEISRKGKFKEIKFTF